MSKTIKAPKDYLNEPYYRMVIPDSESETYTAIIPEFPGCIAQGNSVQEAYDLLEKAALSWIETALDLGQDIPEPSSASEYGGKIALRLPKSLHKQVADAAERDGTSLNQFIVMAVSERIGALNLYYNLIKKEEQGVIQPGVNVYVTNNILNLQRTSSNFGLGLIGRLSDVEFKKAPSFLPNYTREEVRVN